MSEYEILYISISSLALLASGISIYRTRKNDQIQNELSSINARLSQKQLDRIEEEEYKGQPNFAVLTENTTGIGDSDSPEYRVKIDFTVQRSGEEYLRAIGISLVTVEGGVFKSCYNPYLEPIRNEDPILSTHTLIIKPNSNIHGCRLHIRYIDKEGWERFQHFKLFADGPLKHLPCSLKFIYDNTYRNFPRVDRWEL